MIINGGQGGRTIGGYNTGFLDDHLTLKLVIPTKVVSNETQHLGATLLAMADLIQLDYGKASTWP